MARPKIAVFSGPTATIQNSEPLVTSNKARARHGLLWHWLVGRSASESGRLRHGDGGSEGGNRCRRGLVLTILAGLNAPLPADFREQLGRLTTPVERYAAAGVPTLFLTSDEDGLTWPELSQTVHEHVPGSRFERVEGAGHSTYFERPDVFNREVAAFVKAHRP